MILRVNHPQPLNGNDAIFDTSTLPLVAVKVLDCRFATMIFRHGERKTNHEQLIPGLAAQRVWLEAVKELR